MKRVSLAFIIISLFVQVGYAQVTFEYLPGDFNMYYGEWPPRVWGNDVTYLVNNFKGIPDCIGCALNGPFWFWASGDVNGTCSANGLDVNYLLDYFRGLNDSLIPCDMFPTTWPDSMPEDPPLGWPPCGTLSSVKKTGMLTDTKDPDIYLWIGRYNGLPLDVQIGQVVDIDVYIQTADSACGGDLHIPLGADTQYVADIYGQNYSHVYYPLDDWHIAEFMPTYYSPPNPAGWMSRSLMGWRWIIGTSPPSYLHFSSPTIIASFAVEFVNDSSLMGQTVSCLGIGEHPSGWPLWVGDTLGINGYTISATISDIHFIDEQSGSSYVTGDVNGSEDYNGLDITYGVAYLKGGPDPACPFGSSPIPPCDAFFYCGDVNGSCDYNGLDITYGVVYLKGGPGVIPCPDCPPTE